MLSRRRATEDGFTLIELIVTIAIISTIMVALVGVVFGYLRTTNSTSTRLNETTDQQFVSAYWQQDVSSLGVHGFEADGDPQLPEQPSVWTGSAPSGVPSGCTSGLPGAVVVGFAWKEYQAGSLDATATWNSAIVNAAVYTAKANGAQTELWRTRCHGGTATSIRVARFLTGQPQVTCLASDGSTVSCGTTDPLPAAVSIKLDVRDTSKSVHASTGYSTTLTAERREG